MLHSCQAQAQFVLQEVPESSCPCTTPGAGPCFQAGLCNRAEEEPRAGVRQQGKPSGHHRDAELQVPQSSGCRWGRCCALKGSSGVEPHLSPKLGTHP